TQMDAAEAVAQLKGAARTARALDDAAEGSGAPPLAANQAQTDFIAQVDPEQKGRYQGAVAGQSTTKPGAGAHEGGDPVERFARPGLLAASPRAIASAPDAGALARAGAHLHLTTPQNLHLAAAHGLAGVRGRHGALYAGRGPSRVVAANGPLGLQARARPLGL